jgi:hypothetical protein
VEGDETPERKQVKRQKRKLSYISNILVISDPKHPENNGQVFLFKYGKKIYDKIMDKAKPTFEDEIPINVFDYWEGANFKLRMKVIADYPNYDSSEFDSISAIAETDEEILTIVQKQFKLSELVGEDQFKTYDEMKKRLAIVMSGGSSARAETEMEPISVQPPSQKENTAPPRATKPAEIDEDNDEDMLSYFQSISDAE